MECHHHDSGNRTPIFHLPLLVSRFFLAALRKNMLYLFAVFLVYMITMCLRPLIPKISLVTLFTVCHRIHVTLQEKTMSFFVFTGKVILAIPSSINVTGSLGGGEESITLFG
ncbi:unnamed protein product [Pocillopora meandrina]|uniref:Uncharacterized protein n=1 Tax=Pocillopora meandrina TaxID=46732 RepID=A0AAU9WVR0_9CNID|nr:unnamed protein product [Pocillopora meandrina]